MRVLICGGRNYQNKNKVFKVLDKFHEHCNVSVIIHGGATGADSLADEWAKNNNIKIDKYDAEWEIYGNAAGPLRNAKMLAEGKPAICIAFPGNDGTLNMIRQCVDNNVKVIQIN